MKDLITAAEAALNQLKYLHREHDTHYRCSGPERCPTAAAIANLEAEIAKAKRETGQIVAAWSAPTQPPEAATAEDWQAFKTDCEFQAVAPFKVEDVGDPHIAAQILDAAAAIEVRPSFMSGTRLCVTCEQPLPSTTHAAVTRCERCMA